MRIISCFQQHKTQHFEQYDSTFNCFFNIHFIRVCECKCFFSRFSLALFLLLVFFSIFSFRISTLLSIGCVLTENLFHFISNDWCNYFEHANRISNTFSCSQFSYIKNLCVPIWMIVYLFQSVSVHSTLYCCCVYMVWIGLVPMYIEVAQGDCGMSMHVCKFK